MIVGIDGRILASSKSEKMDPGLYDFAKYKAQTSCFKGVATEELPARNGQALEIMDIGRLKVIRGVQGGIPLYYQGKRRGRNRGKRSLAANRSSHSSQRHRKFKGIRAK